MPDTLAYPVIYDKALTANVRDFVQPQNGNGKYDAVIFPSCP